MPKSHLDLLAFAARLLEGFSKTPIRSSRRTMSATAGAKLAQGSVPADGFDAELAELNSRIDAIENITSGKARGMTP